MVFLGVGAAGTDDVVVLISKQVRSSDEGDICIYPRLDYVPFPHYQAPSNHGSISRFFHGMAIRETSLGSDRYIERRATDMVTNGGHCSCR
jgi:hypothetical protein